MNALPKADIFFYLLDYWGIPGADVALYEKLFVFGFSVALCLCIVYLLFTVFGTKQLLPQFVSLGGVCSRFIMGWSPTVFASKSRTAMFLYMAMLIVCLCLVYKLYTDGKITGRYKAFLLLPTGYMALIRFSESIYGLVS